ncbi:threonylcarbamoyl-AMP synthase [Yimella sp. cx-573]|nr:threonylcarbamoyl-AMP synthase [Yimella sp. cx-573]
MIFDCSTEQGRTDGVAAAVEAARMGRCVVLPTDTVYGIGTDAFSAAGVDALLAAKGRGREMPPPVLIGDMGAVDGLATAVPSYARRLMEAFWPGALTLVFRSQPSLAWDLGDTNGTVGLRIPDDEVALDVLRAAGPMAVSSANRTGQPTATTITEAGFAFGPAVEVYLDAGVREGGVPSTILDCTKADPVVLRAGAISAEQLREVLGSVELLDPEADLRAFAENAEDYERPADVDPETGERMPVDLAKPGDDAQPSTDEIHSADGAADFASDAGGDVSVGTEAERPAEAAPEPVDEPHGHDAATQTPDHSSETHHPSDENPNTEVNR